MRHKSFLFQVHRAYENKLHERCEFANAFLGKCWENGVRAYYQPAVFYWQLFIRAK